MAPPLLKDNYLLIQVENLGAWSSVVVGPFPSETARIALLEPVYSIQTH